MFDESYWKFYTSYWECILVQYELQHGGNPNIFFSWRFAGGK